MSIMDKVGVKLMGAKDSVVQKTSEVTEIMKLEKSLSDTNKVIGGIQKELGEALLRELEGYNFDAQKMNVSDNMRMLLMSATANTSSGKTYQELLEEIKTLQEKLNKAKNIKVCLNCGSTLKGDASFCPSCGNKIV